MAGKKTITTAFNLRADGSIVLDGDHAPGTSDSSPWALTGVAAERVSLGEYRITGPSIAWPDGWRSSPYRDDNGDPTIRLALGADDNGLTVTCRDPETGTPKDIVYLLTLRVAVTIDEIVPVAEDQVDTDAAVA